MFGLVAEHAAAIQWPGVICAGSGQRHPTVVFVHPPVALRHGERFRLELAAVDVHLGVQHLEELLQPWPNVNAAHLPDRSDSARKKPTAVQTPLGTHPSLRGSPARFSGTARRFR